MSDEIKEEVKEETGSVKVKTETTAEEQIKDNKETEIVDYDKKVAAVDALINPEENEEEIAEEADKKVAEEKENLEQKEVEDSKKELETTPDDSKSEVLPARLLQAAKRNHLSDEDVKKLGDKAELVLSHLADNSDKVSAKLGELGRKFKETQTSKITKKEEKSTPKKLEVSEDDMDEVKTLKEVVNSLTSQISDLREQSIQKNAATTQAQALELDKKIDGYFDGIFEEHPEFGKTDKLSKTEEIMRKTTWELADDILTGSVINGQQMTVEEALSAAMSIYESKNPSKKKVSRDSLLKEVDKREKQFIQRPSTKNNNPVNQLEKKKGAVKAVNNILKKGQGWD